MSKESLWTSHVFDSFVSNQELQTQHTEYPVKNNTSITNGKDIDLIISELSGKEFDKNIKVINTQKKPRTNQETNNTQAPPTKISIQSQQEWVSQCIQLVEANDYLSLKNELIRGAKSWFFIPIKDLSNLIQALNSQNQHQTTLAAFKLFKNRTVEKISDSINQPTLQEFPFSVIESVIRSAYYCRDLQTCVSIYVEYCEKLPFSEELANSAIKSYYKMGLLTQGNRLLERCWDKATEKILISAICGISSVSANSTEIANLFYNWRQTHSKISPELYATVLEQFLYLHDSSKFIEFSAFAKKDGYLDHPRLQEVIFQQLLHEKNTAQIQAYIAMIQSNGKMEIEQMQRPLNNAVSHFAREKDGPGVSMVIDFYSQLDLPYSHHVLNALLSLIISKGDPSYLVSYMEEFSEEGIIGSNATINLIWKGMLKAHETEAVFISNYLKELVSKYPLLSQGLSEDTFELSRIYKYQKARVRQHNYINDTKYSNSTLAALRQIEVYNTQSRPQEGIKVIEHLKSQGIKPRVQLFNALLTGICKCRLKGEFDIALKMMENEGYKPSIDLEVVFLRTYLAGLSRANNFKSAIRTLALNKLSGFVSQHRDALSRRAATSLGFEYLFWQDFESALTMFDMFREPQENNEEKVQLSSSNHNTDSLTGLVTALHKLGRIEQIESLCREIVNVNTRIVIKPLFLKTVQKIAKENFRNQNVVDAAELALRIKEIDIKSRQYIKENVMNDLQKVDAIFEKWEKRLKEKESKL